MWGHQLARIFHWARGHVGAARLDQLQLYEHVQHELGQLDLQLRGVQDSFADYEPHVLVANPDGAWTPQNCDAYRCPTYEPNCGPDAEEYACYAYNGKGGYCDKMPGAGILFKAGPKATNVPCQLFGGHRYIIPARSSS